MIFSVRYWTNSYGQWNLNWKHLFFTLSWWITCINTRSYYLNLYYSVHWLYPTQMCVNVYIWRTGLSYISCQHHKWIYILRSSTLLLGSHCPAEFSSIPNETHLEQLIELYGITLAWKYKSRCAEAEWQERKNSGFLEAESKTSDLHDHNYC